MKVTLEWLKEFVETDASASEIGALLTMLGFELESIQESPIGPVLDFKVTPNRGDCLSVLGVARELCAKDPERFKPTPLMRECVQGLKWGDEEDAEIKTFATVEVLEPDLCPRYGARVFREIEVRPSSERIQARLLACGMRPINLIVDLTNYVMLELGQPLHAFDLDLLSQSTIVVRLPKPGERLTTLDGVERPLKEDMLLICDAEKPVAIAGVMGGANSEVHPKTKNILLESAHFHSESIRKTRKQLGLSTDASYRFERYVDPEGVACALNRFAYLLQQEGGREPVRGIWDVRKDFAAPQPVVVRPKRWNLILGLEIPTAVAGAHLHSLGCLVKEEKDGSLRVTPPSWRTDLKEEDDFVEEIGRVYGYEKIPERLPEGRTVIAKEDEMSALLSRTRQVFLRLGFTEVLNHTFCEPSPLDSPYGDPYRLRNPVAPEFSLLRNSLLPGLMNVARKHPRGPLFLFEIGRVYTRRPVNQWAVGFLMRGRLLEEHWEKKESPDVDFYAGKGVVEQFLQLTHYSHLGNLFSPQKPDPRFDPAFQAGIGDPVKKLLGIFGELRRSLTEEFHMTERVVLGEIFLEGLMEYDDHLRRAGRGAPALRYKPLSPYPPVRRDIAIAVPKTVRISEIERAIREEAGDVLESLRLVDRYEGRGIPEGHHSLAFAMVYRHPQRTLTDEEANEIRDRVLSRLSQLGARAR